MYFIKYFNEHENTYKYTEVNNKEDLSRVMILKESDGDNTEIQLYKVEEVEYKLEIKISEKEWGRERFTT